jgi:hypothetical protein
MAKREDASEYSNYNDEQHRNIFSTPKNKSMFDHHHMATTDEYTGLAKVLFESQSKGLTGSAHHGQYSCSQAIYIVYPVIREVDMR